MISTVLNELKNISAKLLLSGKKCILYVNLHGSRSYTVFFQAQLFLLTYFRLSKVLL